MSPVKGNHLSFSQLLFHPRFVSSHTCEVTDATSIYDKINISVFLNILKFFWIRRTDSRTFQTALLLQWPTSIIFKFLFVFVFFFLLSRQLFSTNKPSSHNNIFQVFSAPHSSVVILTICPTSRAMYVEVPQVANPLFGGGELLVELSCWRFFV